MGADLATLFNDFDRGRLSRRQLLMALGLAVAVRPASAFAQGQCGGARAGSPDCDTTPAKLPFEATGWKTVLLDHFSCQAADYPKEAAYYAALMNWKIRSDDGKQAVLDIGDWGGLILRGGYVAPPPAPAGDAAAAGRAGGRGGGAGAPRAPRLAAFDNFCWGVEPWDAKTIEAELRKRGLTPVADNHGHDFQSFHVKDPDGFDLQISNGNRKNRRQGAANGKTSAPAPFEPTNWKSIWLDHISFEVSNYKETVAFYTALLGWKPGKDEGSQNQCEIGDVGDIIIRHGFAGNRGGGADATPPARRATMGHIAFGITPFDPDQVQAELEKRGLTARVDTGGRGDIHTAAYKSYHTTTPNGYDLQISATTRATRSPA
ncbi:MAG TPA: VOC family protein [Vicinamibacterales bacterium]|jgi:catechol 2,3-dioxygenase-like lactoylglutathione lyase family enzyme|nr:VOC family protein [Vicinamibacterales bacterium]